jgi:nucleotide-binding universal stress UspA family protein
MFHKVIIGVDGLDATGDTIAYARTLAPGAEFILACAYPYQAAPVREALLGYSQALRELTLAMLEREAAAAGLVGAEYVAIADPSAGRALGHLAAERGTPAAAKPTAIGVAFDGTPESREALQLATELAGEVGASLELVDAIDAGALAGGWSAEVAGFMEERRATVQQRLTAELEQLPVPATATATVGSVAEILGELTERVQLVVCGSRGWGPLAAVTLGSAADRLIHDARCPVLVVPRAASERSAVADTDVGVGHATAQG